MTRHFDGGGPEAVVELPGKWEIADSNPTLDLKVKKKIVSSPLIRKESILWGASEAER